MKEAILKFLMVDVNVTTKAEFLRVPECAGVLMSSPELVSHDDIKLYMDSFSCILATLSEESKVDFSTRLGREASFRSGLRVCPLARAISNW
jgi:hypothetical protein